MNIELVVMGASLGGLKALKAILSTLPKDLPLPLVVVQHRGEDDPGRLASVLQGDCAVPVVEPEDKDPIAPGRVYLAPADYHLLIENKNFALSTDAPVHHSRPSIDVLFESAADACGKGVLGVLLTGANEDGAAGLAAIKRRGGRAVVQDPATAEGRAMPEAAIAAGAADHILPLEEIGPFIEKAVGRKQ